MGYIETKQSEIYQDWMWRTDPDSMWNGGYKTRGLAVAAALAAGGKIKPLFEPYSEAEHPNSSVAPITEVMIKAVTVEMSVASIINRIAIEEYKFQQVTGTKPKYVILSGDLVKLLRQHPAHLYYNLEGERLVNKVRGMELLTILEPKNGFISVCAEVAPFLRS